jgi:DNA primase
MIKLETIQEVQSKAQIEEVVGDFITLKQKGQNFWACCPFHHEKTPSFSVSPSKGYYKCFGCDAAGDSIAFVREMESVSFIEAVKYLANKYGISIQETNQPIDEAYLQAQHEKDSLYILLNIAQTYYSQILWEHAEGKNLGQSYLQERGFTEAIIRKFALGYSLNSWQSFYHYAQSKGYSNPLLEKAGLIRQKETKIYDYFRGRLMFPIHHVSGQVIAFGARILKPTANQPKYLNSLDSSIYHKGEVLYGLYQAKNKLKQADNCYVVEGYTDVLTLHMLGIENVVAASGTAFTETQVQLIRRFTKNVTLLFDGDQAGIKATLKGVDTILAMGLHVQVILLPTGEDPDSYARKLGKEAFKAYLQAQVEDFITFKTKYLIQGKEADPTTKSHVIQEILQSISAIPDTISRALFIQQTSKLLNIDAAILFAEQDKLLFKKYQLEQRATKTNLPSTHKLQLSAKAGVTTPVDWTTSIEFYERESIRMLLNYGSMPLSDSQPLCYYLLKELADVEFKNSTYQQIFALYQQQLQVNPSVSHHFFLQHTNVNIQKAAIDLMANPYEVSGQWEKRYHIHVPQEHDNLFQVAYKNILRLKLRLIHQLIEVNNLRLQQATTLDEEEQLLQVYTTLKKSEMDITRQLGIVVIQ